MDTDRAAHGKSWMPLNVVDRRVVTIGGGTGPFALLSQLKDYPCSLTAIVTMTDSGGSSRRLMDEFGQLPFGDLRQALVALSRKGDLWRSIFTFRFRSSDMPTLESSRAEGREEAGTSADQHVLFSARRHAMQQSGVGGHCLGNLIISALEDMNESNLLWALEDAQELLGTAGRVFPVTLARSTLCAELDTGEVIYSESEIDTRGERDPRPLPPIRRLFLRDNATACEAAIRAIRRADVLVLGPGDLYTSILPNLLVRGVPEAIQASTAQKVYVCNLMTKHGETDSFSASDFVRELERYLGTHVDRVVMHDGSFPDHLLHHYAAKQQYPVQPDVGAVRQLAAEVIMDDFLAIQGGQLVRHNPGALIEAIFGPLLRTTHASAPVRVSEEPARRLIS